MSNISYDQKNTNLLRQVLYNPRKPAPNVFTGKPNPNVKLSLKAMKSAYKEYRLKVNYEYKNG